ncbi:MAG: 3-oxoacyl-[acyl-carrier-protein] reductase [Phycisphaeraceae bacterium]|nr:MAG: 3-oxoacyl-[acyl-carrier-protein] reductase [Phycisphaeraceae bacterium]
MSDIRTAIVTGASRGIGKAIALRLARDGRHVALVSRSAGPLGDVKHAIEAAGGKASVFAADVADNKAFAETIEKIATDLGRIDILVNNAGITKDGLILRMSDEDWNTVIQTNLTSCFVAIRAAARHMMRGKFGRIVNISSTSGVVGNAGQANYAAAKAGLIGLSKTVARELGGKNITCNVVAPGFIETDMTSDLPAEIKDKIQQMMAIRRLGVSDDIAAAIAYLTADDAGYITGQTICVDGGMTMC